MLYTVLKHKPLLSYFETEFIDFLKYLLPFFWLLLLSVCLYFSIKKLIFFYNCWKKKTLKAYFFNWIFNKNNINYIKKLGITLPNFFFINLMNKYINSIIWSYIILFSIFYLGIILGTMLFTANCFYFVYFLYFRLFIFPIIKSKLYPYRAYWLKLFFKQ